MGDKYTEKKSAQLGMPFGTANGRLRKNILFSILAKYGDNICYRCNEMIVSVDDLSIEHKEAWLDNDPALFWDLDNIAFSHLSCNVGQANQAWREGFVYPDRSKKSDNPDEKWCSLGKHFVVKSKFSSNAARWDKLAGSCKECTAAYKRRYYKNHSGVV